jgi:hypothetical protein
MKKRDGSRMPWIHRAVKSAERLASFFDLFEGFFTPRVTPKSTGWNSAIRDYNEFAVFAGQWR